MPRARPDADTLARVVLDRYVRLRPGEPVTVETWSHGLPWARALLVEARRRGAPSRLVLEDEPAFFRALGSGGGASIAPPGPERGVHLYLPGPEAFPRLLGLPARELDALVTRHDRSWWSDARRRRTRAFRLAVGEATPSAAERFGVDRAMWEAELIGASTVDPARLARAATGLRRRLGRGRRLRIRHPNGTELLAVRDPRGTFADLGQSDPGTGLVWARLPAGLLVLPLRRGLTDGTWEANRPSYDRYAQPPLALGGRFTLRAGRLAEFAFDRGGEPFAAAQARLGRGRVRAVALTVGLNPAISMTPELQELAEGTVGLLLGESPYHPHRARPRFAYLTPLADAEIDVEGRPWLRPGR